MIPHDRAADAAAPSSSPIAPATSGSGPSDAAGRVPAPPLAAAPLEAGEPTAALAPGEPDAIFVVGVSRSGTTLMRMVLGKHSRIAIADENHYMGHLLPWVDASWSIRRFGDLQSDEAVRRLVDRIYSDEFQRGSWLRDVSQFWRWLRRHVPPEELLARMLAGERSERGVFTALLRAYADARRKPILGEKTPAHLRHVDTLIAWFPAARVIHMVRDPRAVYLSELKRRTANATSFPYRYLVRAPKVMRAFVLLQVAQAWADAIHRHRALSRRYPQAYRVVRFEDLVGEPQAEVGEVCRFLGVAFETRMLRQKVVSRGDRLGESGFDTGAADRWRERISPREARLLQRLLGRRIEEMGYPRA